MQLTEFRAAYPVYDDLSDAELADSLHRKFYSDVPRAIFDQQIGLGVNAEPAWLGDPGAIATPTPANRGLGLLTVADPPAFDPAPAVTGAQGVLPSLTQELDQELDTDRWSVGEAGGVPFALGGPVAAPLDPVPFPTDPYGGISTGEGLANLAARGVAQGGLTLGRYVEGGLAQQPSDEARALYDEYLTLQPSDRDTAGDLVRRVQRSNLSPTRRDMLTAAITDVVRGSPVRSARDLGIDDPESPSLQERYEGYDRSLRTMFPASEETERSFAGQIAQGLGSTAVLMPFAAIPGGIWVGSALMGAGEAQQRAAQAGATGEQQAAAGTAGVAPGLLDAFSIDSMIRGVSRTPGAFGWLRSIVLTGLRTGVIEGTTEGVQQAMQNAIAQVTYDPDAAIAEGVPENVLVGFAVGGILGGAGGAFSRRAPAVLPERPEPPPLDTARTLPDGAIELPPIQVTPPAPRETDQVAPGAAPPVPPPTAAPTPPVEAPAIPAPTAIETAPPPAAPVAPEPAAPVPPEPAQAIGPGAVIRATLPTGETVQGVVIEEFEEPRPERPGEARAISAPAYTVRLENGETVDVAPDRMAIEVVQPVPATPVPAEPATSSADARSERGPSADGARTEERAPYVATGPVPEAPVVPPQPAAQVAPEPAPTVEPPSAEPVAAPQGDVAAPEPVTAVPPPEATSAPPDGQWQAPASGVVRSIDTPAGRKTIVFPDELHARLYDFAQRKDRMSGPWRAEQQALYDAFAPWAARDAQAGQPFSAPRHVLGFARDYLDDIRDLMTSPANFDAQGRVEAPDMVDGEVRADYWQQAATAARAAPQPGAPIAAPSGATSPAATPAPLGARVIRSDTAITPAGTDVPVRYALVELDSLVPSQTDDGAPNPAFTGSQPRDRTRAASQAQVAEIASRLDPRRLDANPSTADGAPLVGPDGMVDSGNGRVLALRRAYRQALPSSRRYREHLAAQGYPVEGMQRPVLVRINDAPAADRARIAEESNARTTLAMSATEQALADAQHVGPLFSLWRGGDITAAANREFVRRFVDRVVPAAERGSVIDSQGNLSGPGVRRIQAAMLGAAYGDANLIETLVESADNDIKAIGGALVDAAPAWAQMKAEAEAGTIDPDMGTYTTHLLEAVRLVQRARSEGQHVADLAAQMDMFGGQTISRGGELFLHAFFRDTRYRAPRGRAKIAEQLLYYVEQARKTQPGPGLFGDADKATPSAILENARRRVDGAEQQQGDLLAVRGEERRDHGEGVPQDGGDAGQRAPVQPRDGEGDRGAAPERAGGTDAGGLSDERSGALRSGAADRVDPAERFQAPRAEEPAPPFYSALTRGIEAVKITRGPRDQWVGIVQNLAQKGVKRAEIEWSGVEQWLRDRPLGQPITKQDVLDYLRSQEVQVREVVKDGQPDQETKYDQYTLPGGRNYRELLLTLPREPARDEVAPTPTASAPFMAEWDSLSGRIRDARDRRAADEVERLEGQRDALHQRMVGATIAERGGLRDNFRTNHFDEPNILAHIRFNERTGANGERVLFIEEIQSDWHQAGRREGYRVPGSRPPTANLRVGWNGVGWDVASPSGRWLGTLPASAGATETEALAAAMEEFRAAVDEDASISDRRVPDAPLKGTWQETAFRRMVRWAAENGFDRVAWTTGDQQADRFDLSKHISEVHYGKARSGDTVTVQALDREGRFAFNRSNVTLDEVEQTFGKDVADKMRRGVADRIDDHSGYSVLSGVNLQVGGEGMRGFYDQILPAYANKFGRRFGARVEPTTLASSRDVARDVDVPFEVFNARTGEVVGTYMDENVAAAEAQRRGPGFDYAFQTSETAPVTVHSLPVTPAMRDGVMREGVPLWQRGGDDQQKSAKPVSLDELKAELRRLAPGVDLTLVDRARDLKGNNASYLRGLIKIALDAGNKMNALRHEAVHALRDLNLISDKEWARLRRRAEQQWIAHYDIETRYPNYTREEQIEEAIAEAFAEHGTTPLPAIERPIWERIRRFLDRLGSWLRGQGFQTVEDVLGRIDRGEVGARTASDQSRADGQAEPTYQAAPVPGDRASADDLLAKPPVPVAEIDKPLFTEASFAEARAAAKRWALANVRGSYPNADLDGPIELASGGIEKAISGTRSRVDLEALRALPDLLRNAIWLETNGERRAGSGARALAYHSLVAPFRLDGTLYRSRLVVRQTPTGHWFYDQHFVEAGAPKSGTTANSDRSPTATVWSDEAPAVEVSRLLDGVKFMDQTPVLRESERPKYQVPRVRGTNRQETAIDKAIEPLDTRGFGRRVIDGLVAARERVADEWRWALADDLDGIKRAAKAAGGADKLDRELPAYVAARFARHHAGQVEAFLRYGAPQWDAAEGMVRLKPGSSGLFQIVEPIYRAGLGRLFEGYAYARRVDSQNLIAQGREQNLTATDVAELLDLANQHPEFVAAFDGIQAYKKAFLDIAQEMGLVSPQQRQVWEQLDHVPFYRVAEEDGVTAPRSGRGLANQGPGVKRLTGGGRRHVVVDGSTGNVVARYEDRADAVAEAGRRGAGFTVEAAGEQIPSVIENIARNVSHLLSASMKNYAAHLAIADAVKIGVAKRVPMGMRQALVPTAQIEKALQAAGINTAGWSPPQIQALWSLVPPTDKDVAAVRVNGKAEFYEVDDKLLLRALTALHETALHPVMKPLVAARKLFTRGITLDPAFMVRNFVRDAMAQWVQTDTRSMNLPLELGKSVANAVRALRSDARIRTLMAAGADTGFYETKPEQVARTLASLKSSTGAELWSFAYDPRRWVEVLEKMGRASEMANRMTTFVAARQRTGSDRPAACEAMGALDIQMRPGRAWLQGMSAMAPFLNARIQGLYRLGRGVATNPKRFIAAGGVLAAWSLALALYNAGDDEEGGYNDLPEYVKDGTWVYPVHRILGDISPAARKWAEENGLPRFLMIPKPFEVGVFFGTAIERTVQSIAGNDRGKETAKAAQRAVMDTLAFNPLSNPMTAVPLQWWANRDFFRDQPIESRSVENLPPGQRASPQTGATARLLGENLDISPAKMEMAVRGFFGTMGAYTLAAMDEIVSAATNQPQAIPRRLDQFPGIRSFIRQDPASTTKWTERFYELRRQVNEAAAGIKEYEDRGEADKAKAMEREKAGEIGERRGLNSVARSLSANRSTVDTLRNFERLPEKERAAAMREFATYFQDIQKNPDQRPVQPRLRNLAPRIIEAARSGATKLPEHVGKNDIADAIRWADLGMVRNTTRDAEKRIRAATEAAPSPSP
ncbi:MAG: LPD38 domain-containing protein [Alphaproteobacteria bacterium]